MALFIETPEGLSVQLDPPMETMFIRTSDGYTPALRQSIEELVNKATDDEYQRGYDAGYEDGKDDAEPGDTDE